MSNCDSPAVLDYDIQIARPEDLDDVHRLTHDSLVAVGDIMPRPSGRLVSYPPLDATEDTTVLVARLAGKVIGTNSITRDGLAGLHTDYGFKSATDQIRKEGRRLASSWRIATDPSFRGGSKLVKDLFRATFREFIKYDRQTCLFVFPLKFEVIYQRMLAASTVAHGEISVDGRKLPAVMMRADVEHLPQVPLLHGMYLGRTK